MIKVCMDEEEFVDLLDQRLYDNWTTDPVIRDLYHDMYWNYFVENGYDGMEVKDSVSMIVDNDYVNYCDVIEKDDDRWEEIDASYKAGEYETDSGFIEAEHNGIYLVRTY